MTTDGQPNDYALKDSPMMDAVMERRRAGIHAGFLLPYLQPGMSLVDIGCGQGTITVGLAEVLAPGEVLGFDLQEPQIEGARKLAADQRSQECSLPGRQPV